VLEARDGIEALDVVASHPGRIELLITDLIMPRMNGAGLTKILLSQRPNLKVLCLTGHPDHSFFPKGETISVLTKPFTPATLGQAVRQVLDSGRV
jgi:YesN/AraC family two-component response regulator